MKLTAELVEAFAGTFLSPLYDDPKPTPQFHREGWELYCSDTPQAAIAAPREHAKSTAFTHDYVLAAALFRAHQYIIVVSSTEELAIEHLSDISKELHDNEDITKEFRIVEFVIDQKTDVVIRCADGYVFRIIARGAGQKMRGRKWMGKRPSLIVCDDLEDDEQVENKESRDKFRRWFLRALRPALRDGGVIRIHGTILHYDSLLNKLMGDSEWKHLFYKAHESFDDFSNILWPEKFPEARLRRIRQSFINQVDSPGYSQEYLNDPFDFEGAYLHLQDFIPMSDDDYETSKLVCAAADFAITQKDHANRTSITVGGKDVLNFLHFLDERVGRWNAFDIIEEMISIQHRWMPDKFYVEKGQIWNALSPILYKEMQKQDVWINIVEVASTKDKAVRGRALQKRMRAGGCRFDKRADWYSAFEAELLRFTEASEATLDDQFDSAALLALGFERDANVEVEDFMTDEQIEEEREAERLYLGISGRGGRNLTTGY